ncbi:fungal hydrophobin-domain-containing protein [Cubamyces menziesii]|uniref:Hydrophobin n=1 Tax=Trametes cubensis TaxID=1111947 RepID=A0AAD7U4G4_9APHY|nr:fungal hydrophobin-domain-containing protein [Cubamyces menziesii]KAJ8496560.1 hypothetical protein ONZ51_g980 [Trametes cubensis]
MKFSYAVATLVAAAASVQAHETNAQRLARGLSPLPPRRMYTPSHASEAKRATPSGSPGSGNCNTGPIQCCNQVSKANDNVISTILGLLDLVIDPEALVGVQCSPLSVVGVGGSSCSSTPVCCENNSQGGLISIGCIPIIL